MCILLADERHGACVGQTVLNRLNMCKQVFKANTPSQSKEPKAYSSARDDKD